MLSDQATLKIMIMIDNDMIMTHLDIQRRVYYDSGDRGAVGADCGQGLVLGAAHQPHTPIQRS